MTGRATARGRPALPAACGVGKLDGGRFTLGDPRVNGFYNRPLLTLDAYRDEWHRTACGFISCQGPTKRCSL